MATSAARPPVSKAGSAQDKAKALAMAMASIEKSFGKNSIMKYSDDYVQKMESYSTGSLGIDAAIGVGGIPRGRVIEIYGPESSGKTTLCLSVIAQAQKEGATCAFIDAEHAMDVQYAEKIGVKTPDLIFSQPDSGEQALSVVEILASSGAVDLIVVDSVAALTPENELKGDMGASLPGLQARLMSQALRKLTAVSQKNNCTIIFINQLRQKIGVMFGPSETTTGGNALKFYASVRIDVRRTGSIKRGEEVIGNETKIKIVKNKVAPPFKIAELTIMFGEGFSIFGEVVDYGVKAGIIEKAGSWYSYAGNKIGQGRDNSIEYLKTNKELGAELYEKVRASLLQGAVPVAVDSSVTPDPADDVLIDDPVEI